MARTSPKLLLTGISGLLGNNLAYYLRDEYSILGLYGQHSVKIPGVTTASCELTDPAEVQDFLRDYAPDVMIHSAAWSHVDQCEADPERARRQNVLPVQSIVESLPSHSKFIYISTDSVYDGIQGNFREDSPVAPCNVYGQTKLEGEKLALQRPHSLILRVNFYGWNLRDNKYSLAEWMLAQMKQGKPLNGFQDVIFSSLYSFDLARVLDLALQYGLTGLFNCGTSDSCSKYEFALKLARWFGYDPHLITPVSIEQQPLQAKRGKNLSMDTRKLQNALNYPLPSIDWGVEAFYRDFRAGLPEALKRLQLTHRTL